MLLAERLTVGVLITGAALLSRRARLRVTMSSSASAAPAARRPLVVGLTGSIGMGKSTSSAWWRRCGVRVHDSDACVHELYGPGGAAVAPVEAAFPGVTAADGSIDRAALAKEIGLATAGRAASLKTLEHIVHPLVHASRQEFVDKAAADGEFMVITDVPLLFETHPTEESLRADGVDEVLVVSAPYEVQRKRVLERPGMSEEKLAGILARQTPDGEKRRRADTIVTTESLPVARAELARCVGSLAARHAPRWEAWLAAGRADGGGKFPAPTCVSFDLDDTLWPTMPPLLRAQAKLVEELIPAHLPRAAASGAVTKESLRARMGPLMKAQPLLAHDLTELRRLSLLAVAAEHGDPPEAVAPLMEGFVAARSDVAADLYADVAPAIAALRARGLSVGALTNGNCDVTKSGAAVASLFDFAVTAADAGAAKPAVAPFLHAAAAAGVHPAQVVHVGDAIGADLIGALGCGMRAILLTREGFKRPESEPPLPPKDAARWREVATLEEMVAVLSEWTA